MKEIVDLSTKFLALDQTEDLFKLYHSESSKQGFENLVISFYDQTGPQIIGIDIIDKWADYYFDRKFWQIDPAFKRQRWDWKPHMWRDCFSDDDPKEILNFMAEAEDAGLKNGMTISLSHLGLSLIHI